MFWNVSETVRNISSDEMIRKSQMSENNCQVKVDILREKVCKSNGLTRLDINNIISILLEKDIWCLTLMKRYMIFDIVDEIYLIDDIVLDIQQAEVVLGLTTGALRGAWEVRWSFAILFSSPSSSSSSSLSSPLSMRMIRSYELQRREQPVRDTHHQ